MPVTRKQQILAKIETSEGTSASPGSSDAVLVFEPSIQDTADISDRVPSGPTLSRDFAPIGRKTRTITFKSDFRGSGDVTSPVDPPDWGRFVQACGYRTGTLTVLQLNATAPTAGGFMVSEVVQDAGGALGVVVAVGTGAGLLNGVRLSVASGFLVVAVLSGTFATGLVGGLSSLSTATVSAVAAYDGLTYQPTSEKSTTITTGSWTGTAPAAVGEVLTVESTGGVALGSVQILRDNATGFTNFDATQLYGSIANGNVLRSVGGGTATISAAPVMKRTPSLTIAHNLDGRRRDLLGARGDFTLAGEVGQPMQFDWSFTGDLGSALDSPQITTTGLSSIRPPRLLGSVVAFRLGAQTLRLPTKRLSFANGATVNPNLDANRAGGATGSNVTDRDPSIQVSVDQVHSAFDWEAARDAGTVVGFAAILGVTVGQIVAITAAQCQVVEVAQGDADGVATFDVTMKLRRYLESGDDEVFLSQL